MSAALQRCEALIARHDIQIRKYELLLGGIPRMHPCYESIGMLLDRERKSLALERDYRSRLLDRMYHPHGGRQEHLEF